MELLLSNIPPLKFPNKNTLSCFEDLFRSAEGMRIASGYISTDALAELKNIFEMNKKSYLELVIGMHGFDGFTKSQYEAAKYLDGFLRENNAGGVKVAKAFRFHGKLYSFLKNKAPFAGIIGSSNLNSIFDSQNHYETDLFLKESSIVSEIDSFISALLEKASVPLSEAEIKIIEDKNKLLEGHDGVEKVKREELADAMSNRSRISFEIPVKSDDTPRSNLNVYFGKGRKNKKGLIKPRPWYEVELIVPKNIARRRGYPKAGYPKKESIITVITDDGWKFKCKISGQNSKNFRSAEDLKILGRWIKGRLENSGVLEVGQPVTGEVLKEYGRDTIELTATQDPALWILNFGA
jgi:hypothetical protein